MKFPNNSIILIIFSFLMFICCNSSRKIVENQDKLSQVVVEKITLKNRASTIFNSKELIEEVNFDTIKRNIKSSEWAKVQKLVKKLDLDQVGNWEAPTQERLHDGARATTILFQFGEDRIINSQSFDEGNPPAELKEIYDYLVSLENQ